MSLDFAPVVKSLPFIAQGLGMTLTITLIAMAAAAVFGMVVCLARLASFAPLRFAAAAYVDFFRGLPPLVFLIWVYFGISAALGLRLTPLATAILCLAIQESANLAEIYRAGLSSVPKGQREAALALGLTPVDAFSHVVFPQTLRVVVPAAGNDFVALLKGSSLASILGVYELMRVSQARANYFFKPFEFLTTAAVIYLVLALTAGKFFRWLEKRVVR